MAETKTTSPPDGEDKKKPQQVDAEVVSDLDVLRGQGIQNAETPTELLKAGMALVRLENTTQMTIAAQKPRNEELVLKKCLAELDLYPDQAEEALYDKPVGKSGGVMQYHTDLSIRAAESLAQRWGNCAWGAEPIEDDGEIFTFGVVFLDYETNVRAARLVRVSRKYQKAASRGGGIAYHREDRFNETVVPAAQSKQLREVILRSLPAGLKKAYKKKALEIRSRALTPDQQKLYRKKLVESFAELKISEAQIGQILGKPLNLGITELELGRLRGIYNAIKSGETSIDSVLETKQAAFPEPQQVSAEEALKAAQAQSSEKGEPGEAAEPAKAPEQAPESSESSPESSETPSDSTAQPESEKTKRLTPKQKLIKMLLPIATGSSDTFDKACQQALGGTKQEGLDWQTFLNNITQKELEAVSEALKSPQEPAQADKQSVETPSETSEPATEPAVSSEAPSEGSKPAETEPAAQEPAKADSGKTDQERQELIDFIKNHGSTVENKIAIITEVCGSDFSDQAVSDMADNPELIEDKKHLRSIKNILSMMAG